LLCGSSFLCDWDASEERRPDELVGIQVENTANTQGCGCWPKLVTARGNRKRSTAVSPFVSLVMPIRNEEGCILAPEYPADRMEVLLVDGMCSDRTREIVARFPVRLLGNPARMASTALSIGLRHA